MTASTNTAAAAGQEGQGAAQPHVHSDGSHEEHPIPRLIVIPHRHTKVCILQPANSSRLSGSIGAWPSCRPAALPAATTRCFGCFSDLAQALPSAAEPP